MSSRSRRLVSPRPRMLRSLHPVLGLLGVLLLALGLLGPLPAYAVSSLTVRVYTDSDRNGAFGAEPPVAGVAVRVYNSDNALVGLNTTGADGTIAFPTLAPGPYRVEVAPALTRVVSVYGAFPPGNTLVRFVDLPDAANQLLDVGVRTLAGGVDVGAPAGARTVVARLWDDRDANGIQDAGEPGFPGLQVAIVDVVSNSVVVPAVTTNAAGYAVFPDTAPSGSGFALRVLSPTPAGYALTRADASDGELNPDQRDSDAALTASNVEAPIPTGDTGANIDSLGIGFARGAVSGFIFRDLNRDGGFNGPAEPFIDGITVELRNAADQLVASQATRPIPGSPSGAAGFFEFPDVSLADGPYTLVVTSAPFAPGAPLFGAANSPNLAGGDKGLINGVNPTGVVGPTDTVRITGISITGNNVGAGSNVSSDNLFGFYQGSVGDLVWFDLDRDGVVDAGEDAQGINGVRLFVDDGRGGGTAGDGVRNGDEPSTLTAISGLRPGLYRFDNLPLSADPGRQYDIVLDESNFLPGGILEGLGASTGTVRLNANGNRVVVIQTPGLTDAAPSALGTDFGVTRAEIGNVVFEDADGDGLFDPEESPVQGVTVQLYNASNNPVGTPAVTDATGQYRVPTLPAGSYYAVFTLDGTPQSPGGVAPAYLGSLLRTPTYSGVNPDPAPGAPDENDLQSPFGAGRQYRTPLFSIAPGSVNVGVDAAVYRPVSVSGTVFFDGNQDDVNTVPLADLALQNAQVQAIHTGPDRALGTPDDLAPFVTTTGPDGAYSFGSAFAIPPGRLVVRFLNPSTAAFAFVAPNVGADEAADSDVTGTLTDGGNTYGTADSLSAGSNGSYSAVDAGFTGTTTVAGTAFVDGTANGVRAEATDAALPGTNVALAFNFSFAGNGYSLAREQLTDEIGAYSFTELPGGTFDLAFTAPAATPAYVVTASDVNDGTDIDSDGASTTDGLANQTLTAGVAARRDKGYYQPVEVSGRIWFDSDNDGALETGEPPLQNIAVAVINLGRDGVLGGGDDVSESVTSDATGAYATSTNLPPGLFVVRVTNPSPSDFQFVTTGTDNDLRTTSAGPPPTAVTDAFTVVTNGAAENVDGALTGTKTVSGIAFVDANADGQSLGDGGLTGVQVALTHDVSASAAPYLVATLTRSVTTPASGAYSFANLPGGTFDLAFTAPVATPPWQLTTPNVAPDATDSDGDLIDQPLAAGDTTQVRDQGYFQVVTITARVFHDSATPNNVWNTGEAGIAGVDVALERVSDGSTVETKQSDANGLVSFSVAPGTYRLNVAENDTDLTGAGFVRTIPAADPVVLAALTSGQSSATETAPNGTTNVFGFVKPVKVTGRVWFDVDNDGALETGEPPLQNIAVTVTSFGPNGALGGGDDVSESVTSDAAGAYATSTNLPPGQFVVQVTNPSPGDFQFVTTGTDNDLRTTSAGPPPTASTNAFAVASGATVANIDGALTGAKTVSGKAFVDANADGQSLGDGGLTGVTVALTHDTAVIVGGTTYLPATTLTRSVTTPASGAYSFANLPGGTFDLAFTAPVVTPPWQLTTPNVAPDATDSDGDLIDQPLAAGDTTQVRDQGYFRAALITARVFDEQVAVNNSFQVGEPGLSGVTVNLGGAATASGTTDSTGLVTFTVQPGTYSLSVPAGPALFIASPGNTGTVGSIVVTSGQSAPTAPFGYYKPSTITGSAWYDSDGDGLLTAGEPPMQGIDVTLVGNLSGTLNTAATTAAGAFSFANVNPTGLAGGDTSYQLCFELPAGFAFTIKGAALATNGNSDVNLSGAGAGCTDAFTLGSNTTLDVIDAGYVGALTIGDLVWDDLNGNGLQDTGEPGLAGATVTVEVTTAGGTINSANPTITVSGTSTASTGLGANYRLNRVPPGSGYRVVSVTPPFGYLPTPTDAGADDLDSDPIGVYAVALPPSISSLDFGFFRTTSVGDLVWLDLNGNSQFDAATERGVPGVQVLLTQGTTVVASTTTATTGQVGSYGFVDIAPGTYGLRFIAPDGYSFVDDGAGSADVDNDNDARLDGTTASFTLASGQIRAGLDAGLRGAGAISGLAWIDDDGDSTRGAADTRRVGGVAVTLTLTPTLTGGTASFSATTAADGSYSFSGLPAGSSVLSFAITPARYRPVQANVGADTADSDGPTVSLTVGATPLANVDQGYTELGRQIFLPLVYGVPPAADLTVSFSVNPEVPTAGRSAAISVVVTNKGTGPASNFWVDFYINPARVPQVNDPWNELCTLEPCFGIAWFYEGTLQPGQSVTLNSQAVSATNPNGYRPASSNWPGFFANGTSQLYVIVDSWNRSGAGDDRDPNGALRELDESNNRAVRAITVLPGGLPPGFETRLPRATLTRE